MYTIYKHTNKINKKCYIGQTKRTNIKTRWGKNGYNYKYCKKFYNAIKKYGWDNFEHEVLETNIKTLKDANQREQYWIKYFDSFYNGYNSTIGGNSNLGLSIPVLQIDKNNFNIINRFESITDASEKTKICKHHIINCCKRVSSTAGDFHWCYEKDYNNKWKKPNIKNRNISVVCIETGKIYKNAVEASIDMNIRRSVSGITVCCKGKQLTCRGYHWCYYTDYKKFKQRDTLRKNKVICLETKKIFMSITDAAKFYNVDRSCISYACRKRKKSCGYHWMYLLDYNKQLNKGEEE